MYQKQDTRYLKQKRASLKTQRGRNSQSLKQERDLSQNRVDPEAKIQSCPFTKEKYQACISF